MKPLSTRDVAKLSPEERIALIAQLWDSLDEADLSLSPAQCAELDRRLATFNEDFADGVTWEELKADLRRRRP
jgi:putative addiction module component (TIGR02574 family)